MSTQSNLKLLRATLLILGVFVIMNAGNAATVAGRVVFATGNPVATDSAGTQRSLGRGDDVFSGDDLRTPVNSRLQVSFVDGAYISLQPDSEYQIEEYKYAGRSDGSESAVYRLLKGGVRAVTGLIGKEHPDAYKVKTAVATIGVRGTGHNTRICQGDCPGKDDGLYHSTWEGITYVTNDVETVNVPTGRSVFVRNLNARIQFLNQPPAVTAIDTADEREEQQEEQEDESRVVSIADQRTPEGDQEIIVEETPVVTPTASTVLLNQGFLVVLPEQDDPTDPVDIFSGDDPALFVNDSGELIGLIATDEDDGGRTFGTINLAAMLGGDDTAAVTELNSLLAQADPAIVSRFEANPASIAESVYNEGGLSWGRWSNGLILSFDTFDGVANIDELVDNQSLHYIFGPQPPSFPTMGQAVYNFIGGTRSTSLSGATIGSGVTGGFVFADFGTAEGGLFMTVDHAGINYQVAGTLILGDNEIFNMTDGVYATTAAAGSSCNPVCPTFVDGGFAGPNNSSGIPNYAGLEYDIREDDIITGVAGFGLGASGSTSVTSNLNFTATAPLPTASAEPTFAFGAFGFSTSGGDVIGSVYTDAFDGMRYVSTVDIFGMLFGDNISAVSEFASFLDLADPVALETFLSNPATVAESVINADGSGWGRWANGNVLNIASDGTTQVDQLTGNQSVHFIFGPEPPSIPTTGLAEYVFAGGTRSTSASGNTIGQGVTGGSFFIDFGAGQGEVFMDVIHDGINYAISSGFGDIIVDSANNAVFDVTGGVTAQTSLTGSACNPGCTTFIGGGFAGQPDTNGNPQGLGIEYEIQESDVIMGVAGFQSNPSAAF